MRNKIILSLVLLLVGALITWYLSQIVIYVVVAAIIALMGQPIDRFYTAKIRWGKVVLSPTGSAALAFVTLLLVFVIMAAIFTPLVMEEVNIISALDRETVFNSLKQPVQLAESLLRDYNIPLENIDLMAYAQEKVFSFFTVTNISVFLNQFLNATGNFFVSFFAISFLTFFFLRDEELIINAIFSLVPQRYAERGRKMWAESEELLKRYFVGVLVEMLLVTILLFIGLWFCNIKHALLIAVFAGLMNVIPYVGPLIGCGFALLVGLTTNNDMSMVATLTRILIVFPIVNLTDAFLLQPFIFSSSVRAHPVEIFLVILAGGAIGGVAGMILAVPAYTVLRLIVKEAYIHFINK